MASKSKNKGKNFERELAKMLSELYNETFIRVPHSGAFTGGQNAVRKEVLTENQIQAFKGDVIPPDGWKYFNCEAKNYADFPFHHLLQDKAIPVLEMWLEQTLDAHDENDLDILFMKFDRKGIYFAFPQAIKGTFNLKSNIDYHSKKYGSWTITFWDDFKSNTNNIQKIKEYSIKGTNIANQSN